MELITVPLVKAEKPESWSRMETYGSKSQSPSSGFDIQHLDGLISATLETAALV